MIEPADYFALIIRQPDKIRVVNNHEEVMGAICHALNPLVNFSIVERSNSTCALKFRGNPFTRNLWSSEVDDSLIFIRAISRIIESLQPLSWHVVTSTDIAKIMTNTCIFFRKISVVDQNKISRLARDGPIFSFVPCDQNNILLVDVPSQIENELVSGISSQVSISNHEILSNTSSGHVTSKINLSGWFPSWASTGDKAIALRRMILEVVTIARKHKFETVTNVNIKGDIDGLMFQHKPQGWMSMFSGTEHLFMMSLNRNDRLRLICAPDNVISNCEQTLTQINGVQDSFKTDHDTHEFKLNGNPWWAHGQETVQSRHIIGFIIGKFKSLGWEIDSTLDISRRINDKAIFTFRQCPPVSQHFAVLSFHEADKMRFMSSMEDTSVLINFIDRLFTASGMNQGMSDYYGAKQWKIQGNPWSGVWQYGVDLRIMVHQLTKIQKFFHQCGWRLVSSADISAKYRKQGNSNRKIPMDSHSWFWLHDPENVIMSDSVIAMEVPVMDENYLRPVQEIRGEKGFCTKYWCCLLCIIFFLAPFPFLGWFIRGDIF